MSGTFTHRKTQLQPKRVFGWVEVIFDFAYLLTALILGILLLQSPPGQPRWLSGIMALVLAGGDAFHLIPRMLAAITGGEKRLTKALGLGKLITSLTMTVFYVLLWHLGLMLVAPAGSEFWTAIVYALALIRMVLCLFPQNRWLEEAPPVRWAVYRNLPFLLMGVVVARLFAAHGSVIPALGGMWVAIALSFAFYLPVALFSGRNRKLGMLMLPKTCAYLWILFMCAQGLG
jgi:drug/metabolite transporter superfamily protein YnfA